MFENLQQALEAAAASASSGAEPVGENSPSMTLLYASPRYHVVDIDGLGLEVLAYGPGGQFRLLPPDVSERLRKSYFELATSEAEADAIDELFDSVQGGACSIASTFH